MGCEARHGCADDAFDQIYNENRDAVVRWLHRHGGTDVDADDLAAEAFTRAYRGWDSFRGEASRRTWLWSIVRNTLRNWRRSRARNRDVLTPEPPEDAHEPTPPTELESGVGELLDRIGSERARTAVYLRYVQGCTTEEVAEILGTTPGAVSAMTHRALTSLRRDLIERRGRAS